MNQWTRKAQEGLREQGIMDEKGARIAQRARIWESSTRGQTRDNSMYASSIYTKMIEWRMRLLPLSNHDV